LAADDLVLITFGMVVEGPSLVVVVATEAGLLEVAMNMMAHRT